MPTPPQHPTYAHLTPSPLGGTAPASPLAPRGCALKLLRAQLRPGHHPLRQTAGGESGGEATGGDGGGGGGGGGGAAGGGEVGAGGGARLLLTERVARCAPDAGWGSIPLTLNPYPQPQP